MKQLPRQTERRASSSKAAKTSTDTIHFLLLGDAQGFVRVYMYSPRSLAFYARQDTTSNVNDENVTA